MMLKGFLLSFLLAFSVSAKGPIEDHLINKCGKGEIEQEHPELSFEKLVNIKVSTPVGGMKGFLCVGRDKSGGRNIESAIYRDNTGLEVFASIDELREGKIILDSDTLDPVLQTIIKDGDLLSIKIPNEYEYENLMRYELELRFHRNLTILNWGKEDIRSITIYGDHHLESGETYPTYEGTSFDNIELDIILPAVIKDVNLYQSDNIVKTVIAKNLKKVSSLL